MKQKQNTWLGYTALAVILLGLVLTALLASDGWAAALRNSGGGITSLTLKEADNPGGPWSTVLGNLANGYSLAMDSGADRYLDVEDLTADPVLADGDWEIYFDTLRVPAGFWTYWNNKGVNAGATGDEALMWQILNGEEPIFILRVSGTSTQLIDGLAGSGPWRINGDHPLGTYHFGGWVSDTAYLNLQLTLTETSEVTLTADAWTIDGCGYLDVVIHLGNMHDLYALNIELSFDPAVLEVVDLDPLEAGINLEPISSWFVAGYWAVNEADNDAGTIQYAATQTRPTSPVSGAGDVARIRFRARAIEEDTPIEITKAEFSDRDGFLVGRPADIDDPAAEITTQFSAAGGLDLDIIRLDASTVQLQWPKQVFDTEAEYYLYRSNLPYFELADLGVVPMDDSKFVAGTDTITFDDAVLGNVVDNYFYALRVVCDNDFTSPLSQQVGKFEYLLVETATTDFNWVGLVLELSPELLTASDLADHIEANSNVSVIVETVTEWEAGGQQFSLFAPDDPGGTFDFPLSLRSPYRIEVDVTAGTSTIWAQVGKLPNIETGTYTLVETATTDFTWILQPLDLVEIEAVGDLASHIETNASPSVTIKTVSIWNPGSQQLDTFFPDDPGSVFSTRFGYPYRVEVDVSVGTQAVWP